MANRYWVGGTGTWSTTTTNWSATSGGASGASAPTAVDTVVFDNNSNIGTSAFTVTVGTSAACLDMTFGAGASALDGAMTLDMNLSILRVYGNWTTPATNFSCINFGSITFSATSGTRTVTTNGVILDTNITFDGVGGTWQLQDALTLTINGFVSLYAGTLDLNNYNVTCSGFISDLVSSPRTLISGTGQFYVTGGDGSSLWYVDGTSNYTTVGTPTFNATYAGGGTNQSFIINDGGPSIAVNVNITAGSGTILISTFAGSNAFQNINFTGFAGNVAFGSTKVFGNFTMVAGMVVNPGSVSLSFSGTTGTQLLTSNGVIVQTTVIFNGTATYQLQNSWSCNRFNTVGLTSGTLDLNNYTLTTGIFSSSNSNVRAILFGTGQIYLITNNTTIWNTGTITNLSCTGSRIVNATYSSNVGTRTISAGSLAEASAISFNISAGRDIVTIGQSINDLNFTGFTGTLTNTAKTIYGNLTISNLMTCNAGTNAWGFNSTSGTKTITTNGQNLNFPISFNGPGGTWSLQDALTLGETNGTLSFTNGTITTNNNSVTAKTFQFNTGTRTLNMGASTFIILGTSSSINSWIVSDPVNLTINSGTSTIYLAESYTGISQQNFVGGGFTYYNLVYTGTETSIISGDNTFNTIQNNTQPMEIRFVAGSTQTVTYFNVSGTSSSFVVIGSDTPGTPFNLVKSNTENVVVINCNISDSSVSPADTWFAPISAGVLPAVLNVDSGDNTGWNFSAQPQVYRISQVGVLYSSVAEFDEITQTTISMSPSTMYADEFDEVSVIPNAMRYGNVGNVQVLSEFDEVTVIIPE